MKARLFMENKFFPEIKKNFGFGCMRLPMVDDKVDTVELILSLMIPLLTNSINASACEFSIPNSAILYILFLLTYYCSL